MAPTSEAHPDASWERRDRIVRAVLPWPMAVEHGDLVVLGSVDDPDCMRVIYFGSRRGRADLYGD